MTNQRYERANARLINDLRAKTSFHQQNDQILSYIIEFRAAKTPFGGPFRPVASLRLQKELQMQDESYL